jgi:mono/diheme cytochrome c family protein
MLGPNLLNVFSGTCAEESLISARMLAAAALLLAGCVTDLTLPPPAPDHPANPDAAAAPVAFLPQTLPLYQPRQNSEQKQAPEQEPMKGHDHGSSGEMEHGAMKKMERGATKSVDHDHHWMAPPEAAGRRNPIPRDAASIARGNELFQANCASCHGKDGRGDGRAAAALDPRPANLKTMARHHPDGDFAWKIANGRGAMPAWKGVLNEKQIWDLVNFVKSLDKGKKTPGTEHDHSKHAH